MTLQRPRKKPATKRVRVQRRATSLSSHGEPMVWLAGGALAFALFMIAGLLLLVFVQGGSTFWPRPLVRIETIGGGVAMGEVSAEETFAPGEVVLAKLPADRAPSVRSAIAARAGREHRRMLRVGNFELTGVHFRWISDFEVAQESFPTWALSVERTAWGRFYGFPKAFLVDGQAIASEPGAVWNLYRQHEAASRERFEQRRSLETDASGKVNRELEEVRLALREVEMAHGKSSPEYAHAQEKAAVEQRGAEVRYKKIESQIAELNRENARYQMVLSTADGQESKLSVADILRAYPANQLGFFQKIGVYLSRWAEFVTDVPRDNNNEGGVFPAIFGTVVMTLVMSLLVVPFGVLAALYLREYARPGLLVSIVRIAVNNLAGVPSIVFGVFGLGFFCYIVGASIDDLFYAVRLPNPTFGKGGVLWSSLTLALLTLPVVIVATEEALAAVPGSMREGSYACGATKWQTIQRIVLPRAMPGIMTGMILAIARGAGEVAPLMLVGAVRYKPELAVDGVFPFLHPERAFMHLGFHIYDLGFQSPNSEAAKPMVFTTTLLLIAIIVALNVSAITVRARLRRKFAGGQA